MADERSRGNSSDSATRNAEVPRYEGRRRGPGAHGGLMGVGSRPPAGIHPATTLQEETPQTAYATRRSGRASEEAEGEARPSRQVALPWELSIGFTPPPGNHSPPPPTHPPHPPPTPHPAHHSHPHPPPPPPTTPYPSSPPTPSPAPPSARRPPRTPGSRKRTTFPSPGGWSGCRGRGADRRRGGGWRGRGRPGPRWSPKWAATFRPSVRGEPMSGSGGALASHRSNSATNCRASSTRFR